MVYIKISEEFQNGAQELLNLFFPGNGFVFVDDIPEVSSCDILITLNIEIRDNGLDIKSGCGRETGTCIPKQHALIMKPGQKRQVPR